MNTKNLLIKNAKIVLLDKILNGDLLIKDGKVAQISESIEASSVEIYDAKGFYLTPGLFEVHIHGQGGGSFQDLSEDGREINVIHESLKKNGVNSYLPTFSCDEVAIEKAVRFLEKEDFFDYAVPGIYIEGPFISKAKKGALGDDTVKSPDKDFDYLKKLNDLTHQKIKMMTVAPELPEVEKVFDFLVKNNIVPSIGHTSGSYQDAAKWVEQIEKMNITHLYNAMTGISHRNPGVALVPFLHKNIFFELITDGIHVEKEILQMTLAGVNADRLIVISDSASAAGCPYGEYLHLGERVVSREEGVFYKDNPDVFVGSRLTLNECLSYIYKNSDMSFSKVIQSATYNPALLFGLDKERGSIQIGKKADLVLLNEEFECQKNFI